MTLNGLGYGTKSHVVYWADRRQGDAYYLCTVRYNPGLAEKEKIETSPSCVEGDTKLDSVTLTPSGMAKKWRRLR